MFAYAAVLAKISTSFAEVKTTRIPAKTAVKIAIIPSLQLMLCTAQRITMHTIGSREARIVIRYLVYLNIAVSS